MATPNCLNCIKNQFHTDGQTLQRSRRNSEASNSDEYPEPIVVIIGESGVGKSTFCNFLAGYPDGDPQSFGTGIPVDGSSITKLPEIKRAKWRGDGKDFTIVDTPGLSDPDGSDTDREQFRKVLHVLRYDVKKISAIIHVVKGTQTRNSPQMQKNLKLYKFMFGEAMIQNLIVEVTFWDHYHKKEQERNEFTEGRKNIMENLFGNPSITPNVVFAQPNDALPETHRQRIEALYSTFPELQVIQDNELEKLKDLIWGQQTPFSCALNCKFVEKIFDPVNNYPEIKSGDEYSSVLYEVSDLVC